MLLTSFSNQLCVLNAISGEVSLILSHSIPNFEPVFISLVIHCFYDLWTQKYMHEKLARFATECSECHGPISQLNVCSLLKILYGSNFPTEKTLKQLKFYMGKTDLSISKPYMVSTLNNRIHNVCRCRRRIDNWGWGGDVILQYSYSGY